MLKSPLRREPEWLISLGALVLGAALAEVAQISYRLSVNWGTLLTDRQQTGLVIIIVFLVLCVLVFYAVQRGVKQFAIRLATSRRVDLLALVLTGGATVFLLDQQLEDFHKYVAGLNTYLAPVLLWVLSLILVAKVLGKELWPKSSRDDVPIKFFSDEELVDPAHDVLGVRQQAENFADTVLVSVCQTGLVFGVEGPWGVGKTSFLNIAARRWAEKSEKDDGAKKDRVIVVRFEPLRYASEPDLAERLIQTVCATIQNQVFAPEFMAAAARYSRMLKGETEFSVFGVKLSMAASPEALDDLLQAIDDVLEKIGCRLIVVVDDLDRLEPVLVNSVLFTVRKAFALKRAAYILCYDDEHLLAGGEEGAQAREFLEKFITAKLSLFSDLDLVRSFLHKDWRAEAERFPMVPVDAMAKIGMVARKAGDLLSGQDAPNYVPLLGTLRKVKRFVNALLLMRLETLSVERSDFDPVDLIHLVLLHLYYPVVFRSVYAEEASGRGGYFSVRQNSESQKWVTSEELKKFFSDRQDPAERFLLERLFDVDALKLNRPFRVDAEAEHTRACFNHRQRRNLERYLRLIVELRVPEENSTFRMYKNLVESVKAGVTVREVLQGDNFKGADSAEVHERFWQMLVNSAPQLNRKRAEDAISAVIEWLPFYSAIRSENIELRQKSIYWLADFLEYAGFGDVDGVRARNSKDAVEIAHRIFGTGMHSASPSLISQLLKNRGVLGWNDLMCLRLCCCINRNNGFFNIPSALLWYEEPGATISGVDVVDTGIMSMRRLSQQIFHEFNVGYILKGICFFEAVDDVGVDDLLGHLKAGAVVDAELSRKLEWARSDIKSFVIYQLINKSHSLGIGCGMYDEAGKADGAGINRAMSKYLFDVCFNLGGGLRNARKFGDFFLRIWISNFDEFRGGNFRQGIATWVDVSQVKAFWAQSGDHIKTQLKDERRTITGHRQPISYEEHWPLVREALDQLLKEDGAPADHGGD
jgi:KAP family P-loop domain